MRTKKATKKLLRIRMGQAFRGFLLGVCQELRLEVESTGYAEGSTAWQVYVRTEIPADVIQETIWARNGGGWCEVNEINCQEGRRP